MSQTTEINPASPVAPAAAPKAKITTQVLAQIESLRGKGALQLPADYSAGNALNAAWLALQEVQNREGKPIFKDGQLTNVVTQVSIANSLLDMVIQGLNPAKKQGYFIVYGDKLVWQRSYFGDQALAERVRPGIEIYHAVVYEGDDFEFETIRGRTVVMKHKTNLANKTKPILAAYCGIYDANTGEDLGAEVMTIERIRKSWGMSKTYRADGQGTHNKFPDEMALRTVIRRRTKPVINASTDALLLEAVRRQDEDNALGAMDEEVATNGNRETLALSSPPVQEPAPVAEPVAQTTMPLEPPPGEGETPF